MGGHGWAYVVVDGYGYGYKFEGKCWALIHWFNPQCNSAAAKVVDAEGKK
jgi:hypothetical protein